MSSIGGVLFDRDATYIDLGGSHHLGGGRLTSGRAQVVGAGEADLIKARELLSEASAFGLDEQLQHEHEIRITTDAPILRGRNDIGASEAEDSEKEEYDSAIDSDSSSSDEGEEEDDNMNDEVHMFQDVAFPESMEVDEDKQDKKDAKEVKFDSRHQDIKSAFDGTLFI